jgi:hypothetical protein
MTPEDFQKFFPLVDNWIWAALAAHAGKARPIASCRFPRLPRYFTAETLASAKVVIMDRLPVPPLSSWGLTQFASFERGDPDGITYVDTCFLKPHQSKNEAIHFHELIHVIQWRVLGAERFLRSYADVWNALDIGTVRWKSWRTTQKHGLWLLQLDSTQKSWWLKI